MLFGIDISHYQTSHIDWAKVADAANRFAIIKASEASGYLDPDRLIDFAGAKAAGLYVGIYHFANPAGSGAKQAQLLWDACGDTMPDLPPVLDLEVMNSTGAAQVLQFVRDFIAECEQTFGRKPIMYTGAWFFNALDASDAVDLAECPLWIAEYAHGNDWTPAPTDHPAILKPWGAAWTLWQFSGGAHVDGVPGKCDRDVFNGDEAALRALCGFPS